MKKLILALVFVPTLAFPKPVSFDFAGVSLVAFSQATFKSILGRDYVIAPEVLAADRKITISVRNIESEDVPSFVENLLQQQGIAVTLRNGVYFLAPLRPRVEMSEEVAQARYQDQVSTRQVKEDSHVTSFSEPVQRFRRHGEETIVYVPKNRPTDFLAAVVNTAIGADTATVAGPRLVLSGAREELKKANTLLESIDIMPGKVDVSASWVEVARSEGTSRGVSLIARVLGAKLGVSLGNVNTPSAISIRNIDFEMVVDALNTDGRFKQVSSSRVIGDEYEPLTLTVGDETPTVASTGRDNSGNLVQNIVYRPSGVIVDVLPKILGSGRIKMVIDGQISSFKATQTGVSGSPTLGKRQVKTAVTVADGEVLLIGGLNENKYASTKSALAFLPQSWGLESGASSDTDLVLILSASIVK